MLEVKMIDIIENTTSTLCNKCGVLIYEYDNRPHECVITADVEADNSDSFTFYVPFFGDTDSKKILQKMDKIIGLLEKMDDQTEDTFLSKSGFLKWLTNESNLSGSSLDWQKELDEL